MQLHDKLPHVELWESWMGFHGAYYNLVPISLFFFFWYQ